MARYDKYDPYSGGFRAPLAADWLADDVNDIVAVNLNGSGQVIKAANAVGGECKGVLILTKVRLAGEIVDVMTDGEIVEAGLVAGTVYYSPLAAGTAGVISTTAPASGANGTRIGHTVEAGRLIVRLEHIQAA